MVGGGHPSARSKQQSKAAVDQAVGALLCGCHTLGRQRQVTATHQPHVTLSRPGTHTLPRTRHGASLLEQVSPRVSQYQPPRAQSTRGPRRAPQHNKHAHRGPRKKDHIGNETFSEIALHSTHFQPHRSRVSNPAHRTSISAWSVRGGAGRTEWSFLAPLPDSTHVLTKPGTHHKETVIKLCHFSILASRSCLLPCCL